MVLSSVFSADTDDLDDFADHGALLRTSLTHTSHTLVRQRNFLLGAGFPTVVNHSQLGALEYTLASMSDLDRFVDDISSSLKLFGNDLSDGVFEAPVALARARLDGIEDRRLDDLVAALVAEGIEPDEALWVRQWVEAELEHDPRFEIGGATASEPRELADATVRLAGDRANDLVDQNTSTTAGRNRRTNLGVGGLATDLYFGGPTDGLIPPGLLDRELRNAFGDETYAVLQKELATLARNQSGANWSLAANADGPVELGGDLEELNLGATSLFDESHSGGGRSGSPRLDEAELAYRLRTLAERDPARALALKWILEPMLTNQQRADLDRILATNGDFGEGIGLALAHPTDGAIGAGKGFWNNNFGWLAEGWADATTAITYGFYGMATHAAPGGSPEVSQAVPQVPDTWGEIDSVVQLELAMDNVAQRGGADLALLIEVASAAYGGGRGGLALVRAGRRYFLRSGDDIIAEVGSELARQLDDVPRTRARPSSVYRVQGGTAPDASWERVTLGAGGNLEVSGDTMLFVTFDDLGRAKAYVTTNRPGAKIVAFDIDPAFVEDVRAAAVPQAQGRAFPDVPQIADPTKTSGSYGLPSKWINRLEEAAIPGTGRIIEP